MSTTEDTEKTQRKILTNDRLSASAPSPACGIRHMAYGIRLRLCRAGSLW
ncbi:MAG: hypothetical protein ACR2L2_09210 [Acidobacteriota bacterium]